jgi:hypothetical protein
LVCFKGGFGRDRNKLLQLSLFFFPISWSTGNQLQLYDLQGTNFNFLILLVFDVSFEN